MCKECGCGQPENEHTHDHDSAHGHAHDHNHDHDHDHSPRKIDVNASIYAANDLNAERNRGFFQALDLLVLNVVSSPGSGKTFFLAETVKKLKGRHSAGVIVGDLETDNDARRFKEIEVPAVQVTTGTVCHLDAQMVSRAMKDLEIRKLDFLFIENVGNLVCPAGFDLGENLRVVLLSVTEGEDKPLKYPPMFRFADVIVVSKADITAAAGCNLEALLDNIRRVNPGAKVFEVSAKTGTGMDEWIAFLEESKKQLNQ